MSTNEPELLIVATGDEEVHQIKPTKKIALNEKEKKAIQVAEESKTFLKDAPQEVVKTGEGALIQNFEVDFVEEQEVRMIGGIRGLKALKQ